MLDVMFLQLLSHEDGLLIRDIGVFELPAVQVRA